MKKLLLMLGVAASAVGVFAYPVGSNFDSDSTGPLSTTTSDGGNYYWYTADTSGLEANITAYVSGEASAATTVVSAASQTNYLKIDSTAKTLYRSLNSNEQDGTFSGTDIGNGLYVDTLVKFTVGSTDYSSDDDNAKLAIWFAGEDGDGTALSATNIMVRAGYIDANGAVSATNYTMASTSAIDPDAWHRLTVKAIKQIATDTSYQVAGFVVFVDGTALTTADPVSAIDSTFAAGLTPAAKDRNTAKTLLPSMISTGSEKQNLACVGFSGTGFVDDIGFTDVAPFDAAKDASGFTVSWDAGVASLTVTIGSAAGVIVDVTNPGYQDFELPVGDGVTLTITYKTGYVGELAQTTYSYAEAENATIDVTTFQPGYDVGGTGYETFADAYAAVSSSGGTITMLKASTLDEPMELNADVTVVLDLAGQVLTANSEDQALTISAGTLIITNSTAEAGEIVGTGTVDGTSPVAIVIGADDVTLKVYGGKISGLIWPDGAATYTVELYGGSFLGDAGEFYLSDYVQGGVTPEYANGYWYVGEEAPEPQTGWAAVLGAAVDGAYLIDSLTELKAFQANIASTTNELKLATAGLTFKLTADIALDEPWPGIGVQNGKDIYTTADFEAAAFQGTFDGQNHTISGFQMIGKGDKAEGLDYCGFFNSTYGATIQNLKIAYAGSLFAADTTASTKESGATFVGVAKNSTLRNLTTVVGTVSCSKGFGGIVGYLTSGTQVDSCTNNVNMTSLQPNKCGGIAMITQGGSAVTIRNCQNNGTIAGSNETGSLVGFVGLDTTITDCDSTVAYKLFHHNSGTVTVSGITADASVAAYTGAATPGLNFATVAGNVATFVADNALAAGNTYKVMGPSERATATFEFAAAGTIAFDTALATPTYAVTAAAGSGLEATASTSGTVTTYTAALSWAGLLGAAVDGAYQIDTADDLLALQAGVLAGLATDGVTFKQTANIDMTGVAGFWGIGWFTSSDSKDASITASGDILFAGTYDGQGYTISNVTIVRHNYAGVFNNVSGTVRNLTVQNIGFSGTCSEWGCAIVGNAASGSLLENLTAAASTVWGDNANHNVAGVVVRPIGAATIRGCVNNANITASGKRVGGVAAFVGSGSTGTVFDSCTNTAAIVSSNGTRGVGGILGCAEGNTTDTATIIRNCVDFGSETAQASGGHAGAIVGSNWNGSYTYTDDGGNTFKASTDDCGYVNNPVFGRAYAVASTIGGTDYLTTVKAADLAAGNTYVLLADVAASATPVFTLQTAGDAISFDTKRGFTFAGTVAVAEGLELVGPTTVGTVTTYAAAAPAQEAVIDPATGKVEADTAEEAAAAEVAVTPAVAAALTTAGVSEEAYQAYFTKSAPVLNEGTGKYEVTASIADTVNQGVETSALAVLTDNNATTVTVPAGLYYRITTATALPINASGEGTLSTGTAVSVTKPGTTQGFIKVELSATPFAAE